MGASNEWEVKHLTENGWVSGGYKLDCGDQKEDVVPPGTVLSIRRHVTVGKLAVASSMNIDETESKRTTDQEKINSLLSKYGKPQFGV